jgi:predicted enzyme related to lactoylglutathione lyase
MVGTGAGRSAKIREAMMFKRIDHVEIVTDQLDRTVQFYTDVLGFAMKARDRSSVQVKVCPSTWSIWISAAPSSS